MSSKLYDQNHLRNVQYRTSVNLEARIKLHSRFSTNPYSWQRWVYDQFLLFADNSSSHLRVLEIGCGPANLWRENLDRLPGGILPILGDQSFGMLQAARNLPGKSSVFLYACYDAQAIPCSKNTFDFVIANHMLYHVPDIQLCLREIKRVIKPRGTLITATNGCNHMNELYNFIRPYLEKQYKPHESHSFTPDRFTLENAEAILKSYFNIIDILLYRDSLKVTESGPLLSYIKSLISLDDLLTPKNLSLLKNAIDKVIIKKGYFKISKSQGLVVAQ